MVYGNTRKYTRKVLEMMDEGMLDPKDLVRDLLNWMPESDVAEFVDYYGLNDDEEDEE